MVILMNILIHVNINTKKDIILLKNEKSETTQNEDDKDKGCWNLKLREEMGNNLYNCKKGQEPINRGALMDTLDEFRQVYDTRPFNNKHGTAIMHQFALWSLIRHLDPLFIIESGVNTGLGTWLLRQAAPKAKLIMLDPQDLLKFRDAEDDSVYFIGREFKDFASINWETLIDDKERTLVFIDDHQSHFKRIIQALDLGFKHLIFDDNPYIGGDLYSVRQACDARRCIEDSLGISEGFSINLKDDFGRSMETVSEEKALEMAEFLFDQIDVYFEFPPIWVANVDYHFKRYYSVLNITRSSWGQINPAPLLEGRDADDFKERFQYKLTRFDDSYENICYVKLKHKG
ncbi:unnamed protein product [Owenia fusiformis]|uniref:Uncharacterized protein n=1 Tax=Owenia fusiformis TaxID=6347 RepID=A0A8J1TZX8_OWEFU|nr:unnamed protein product [Owenia fusiformis]